MLPETRDRTLEDIDGFFLGAKNALQPVKVARRMPAGYAEEFDLKEKVDPGCGEMVEDAEADAEKAEVS